MTDKMIKKSAKLKGAVLFISKALLQMCIVLVTIAVILLTALYLRVLWKPINLDFLHSFLQKTLSNDVYDIDLQKSYMITNNYIGSFGIHIDKVIVTHKKDHQKDILQNVTLDLSKRSLLQGKLGFKKISINKIKIALTDKKSSEAYHFNPKEIQAIFAQYIHEPLIKPLRNIIINQTHLAFMSSDHKSIKVKIQKLNLKRRYRYNHHTDLQLGAILKSNNLKGQLEINLQTSFDKHFMITDLQSDIQLKNVIVPATPEIKIDTSKVVLVYNTKNQSFDMRIHDFKSNFGHLKGIASFYKGDKFSLDLQTYQVYDGMFYQAPIGLHTIKAIGQFHAKNSKFYIHDFNFAFDKNVAITGNADFDFNEVFDKSSYRVTADIHNLTLPSLLQLWPRKAAQGGRDWVHENMLHAQFKTSHFTISGLVSDDYPQIALNAPISKAAFFYLKPMQVASDVQGRLIINNKSFIAEVDSAKIDALNVKKSSINIPDIIADIPIGYIKTHIAGALKPLLKIIDAKPLGLMSKSGFQYDKTVGDFSGHLIMELVLLKDVKLEDIKLSADVDIHNGALKVGKKHLPLENINAHLQLTPDNAQGNGSVRLYGIDNQFNWHENFNIKSNVTTDLTLKTYVDDKQIQKLISQFSDSSLKIKEYLQGIAFVDMHLQLQNNRVKQLNIKGHMNDMLLGQPDAVLTLPKGSQKTFNIKAEQQNNQLHISRLQFQSDNNQADFTDIIIDDIGIRRAKVNNITFKNIIQHLHGHYHSLNERHLVALNADAISLEKIINNQSEDKNPDEPMNYFNKDNTIISYPHMLATLNVKKLQIGEEAVIDNASFVVSRDITNKHMMYIDIESSMIEMVKITMQEAAYNKRDITAETNNAGRFLTGVGILDNFKEGHLKANIVQNPNITTGDIQISQGVILQSPWIAKLLSLASLTGILDRLNSRGLSLDRTKLEFSKTKENIQLKNGTMHGSAIGISFQGNYGLKKDNTDIYGTLVPFYGLNTILSDIPIIGRITSSRKSEGIVGLSYSIKGKAEDPEITVNPLSILTFGILRRLFEY